MWNYYKRTCLAVQVATGLVSWMVYTASSHSWLPTVLFLLSMETSALFSALWANQLRNRLPLPPTSRVLN